MMPVTLALALALEEEGNLFAAAERLAADGGDPALRPLARLMIGILSPLIAMGAVTKDKRIDRAALLRFAIGLGGIDEETLYRRMTLEGLQALWEEWQARHPTGAAQPPPAEFLRSMMQLHPDLTRGENPHERNDTAAGG